MKVKKTDGYRVKRHTEKTGMEVKKDYIKG